MKIANNGLQHIGMPVKDAKEIAKWYIDFLGFEDKGSFVDGDNILAFVSKDGCTMEFIQPTKGPMKDAVDSGEIDKIHHLAFDVTDVDKAYSEAVAAGFNVTVPITQNSIFERGTRYFMGYTPEGEFLEFSQIL